MRTFGFDQIQPPAQLVRGNARAFTLYSRGQSSGVFLLSGMTALQPEPHLRFGILPADSVHRSRIHRACLRICHTIDKALRQCRARVHPGGGGHHRRQRAAVNGAAPGIDVEDALLAGLQQRNGFAEVPLIAPGDGGWIVNHIQAARRHLQRVRRRGKHRRRRSRRARDHQMHLARIGADVVVHSNGGVARAAIAVQDNANIVGKLAVLAVERVMQHGRRDLVAVKDLLVDIAVQVNRSQVRSPPFPVPTRCLREQKRRTVPRRYFRTP